MFADNHACSRSAANFAVNLPTDCNGFAIPIKACAIPAPSICAYYIIIRIDNSIGKLY
jgi:hypothetical protein